MTNVEMSRFFHSKRTKGHTPNGAERGTCEARIIGYTHIKQWCTQFLFAGSSLK
jgi:hypothetical protein